jgi:hypothetical protein
MYNFTYFLRNTKENRCPIIISARNIWHRFGTTNLVIWIWNLRTERARELRFSPFDRKQSCQQARPNDAFNISNPLNVETLLMYDISSNFLFNFQDNDRITSFRPK